MSAILYMAHSFPHTRGVKWVESFRQSRIMPIVVYGFSGKTVWDTDKSLRTYKVDALRRKLDLAARRTATRLVRQLGGLSHEVRAVLVRDVFLSRTAALVSHLLDVPWYLDLCDNYPEVLRQQARGRRAWMRVVTPVVDAIEREAVVRASGVLFVTPESRDYVARKLGVRYSKSMTKSLLAKSLVVENAPITKGPPARLRSHGSDLVYIGTFDDRIRDLVTVVRGLALHESKYSRRVGVTLLTFDRTRAEMALRRSGVHWERYVRFKDPVPASELPKELKAYVAGLVPHSASPAVDYTISNKIFDYLYAGIGVLASDNPPNVRLLQGVGAGLCYRREDPQSFAAVLNELVYRRSAGGLQLRPQVLYPRYTWSQQAHAFLEVVQKRTRDPKAAVSTNV